MNNAPPATSAYKLCPVCLNIYPASANFCARDQEELVPDERIFEGKFVLLRQIGAGTMGEVFEAEQPRLRRRVALKLLRPDPEVMRRFDQEVEAAGSLNHPHVVTIYDSGRTGDGRGYIVMEYLEGQSLAERLRQRGSLPVGAAVSLWLQAVRAMAAAHGQGVVHRDLKPDNLFLSRRLHEEGEGGADGPRELVKVLDFSIAKLAPPLTGKAARRSGRGTLPGSLLGTMPYMAPEQLEHGEADARSDVYALGLILAEMLTGRLPWGETRDESFALFALRLLRPPRLLREMLKPGLFSPELEALISDALRKEPAGRPAHAGELLSRARLLPELRGDTGPLRAVAPPSSSEAVTTQVVAPPSRPGGPERPGSAGSEETTQTSVAAPQGPLAETTPPGGSQTGPAAGVPMADEVTPRIAPGRSLSAPQKATPRVPIGDALQQTLPLIELPQHAAPLPTDREARSAAVIDREARSAAVPDREARSAAVSDREARSAAVTDREARSAAVTDREARSAAVPDREARSAAVPDREARSAAVSDQQTAQRTRQSGGLELTPTPTPTVTELKAQWVPPTQMLPRVERAEVTADRRAPRRPVGPLVAVLLGVGIATMVATLLWLLWRQPFGPPVGSQVPGAVDLRGPPQPDLSRQQGAEGGAPLVVHFVIPKPRGFRMWCGGQQQPPPDCHGEGDRECKLTVALPEGQDCEAEQGGQRKLFTYAELQRTRADRRGAIHVLVFFE